MLSFIVIIIKREGLFGRGLNLSNKLRRRMTLELYHCNKFF